MGKFADMRFAFLFVILILSGCATVQAPDYISRVDHPYDRKIYASFEKVTSSVVYALKIKGWTVDTEANPSIYERDDRYDNNGYQNLLIITNIKKYDCILCTSYTHLNVFIHCFNNSCDVEVRCESKTPLLKQFISTRNDQLAQGLLDMVEQEAKR